MRDPISQLLNHIFQFILQILISSDFRVVALHYLIQHSIQSGYSVLLFG